MPIYIEFYIEKKIPKSDNLNIDKCPKCKQTADMGVFMAANRHSGNERKISDY